MGNAEVASCAGLDESIYPSRLFVSDRQALRCDNAVGCKDSQQHRPRRWLLSGGSQPRRSQLTERADSVAQAGVIIRRVLKLPQAMGRQSSQRWLRRRPPVYSKNS